MREIKMNREELGIYSNFCYRRKWKRITSVLAFFVAIGTVSALMLPAVTMNRYVCGMEEHSHGPECYRDAAGEEKELICEKAEHDHTDACRESVSLTEEEQEQINEVTAAIVAIPNPQALSAELKSDADAGNRTAWDLCYANALADVTKARAAWDALPEELRGYVESPQTLLSAEKVLADAVPPMTEEELSQQQVSEVTALIESLPTSMEIGTMLASEEEIPAQDIQAAQSRIQGALDAYNALTSQQQKEVSNATVLMELESMLPALQSAPVTPAAAGDNTTQEYQPVLPATGGHGIIWYIMSGLLLMAAAAVLLYRNLRII